MMYIVLICKALMCIGAILAFTSSRYIEDPVVGELRLILGFVLLIAVKE